MKIVTGLGVGVGVLGLMLTPCAQGESRTTAGRDAEAHRGGAREVILSRNSQERGARAEGTSWLELQEGVALTGWVDSESRLPAGMCAVETEQEKNNKYMIGLTMLW
ncbi:MAG: hypothetical protein HQL91_06245 [Magnetococcales bacterium]|nr:hypothetical protein [Magnetococcales bacterium]